MSYNWGLQRMIEKSYSDFARGLREDGQLSAAGSYYSSSAFGYLMKFRSIERKQNKKEILPTKLGYFSRNILLGALCHRITGNDSRTELLCRQGVLAIKEVLDHEPLFQKPEREAPIGLCHEMIADFRVTGKLDSPNQSYFESKKYYKEVGNQRRWSVEPEFEVHLNTLVKLTNAINHELPSEKESQMRNSLVDRIEYKEENFEKIIKKVVEVGNWDSDLL